MLLAVKVATTATSLGSVGLLYSWAHLVRLREGVLRWVVAWACMHKHTGAIYGRTKHGSLQMFVTFSLNENTSSLSKTVTCGTCPLYMISINGISEELIVLA